MKGWALYHKMRWNVKKAGTSRNTYKINVRKVDGIVLSEATQCPPVVHVVKCNPWSTRGTLYEVLPIPHTTGATAMPAARTLTKAQETKLARLLKQGMPRNQIAKELKLPPSTLGDMLKRRAAQAVADGVADPAGTTFAS